MKKILYSIASILLASAFMLSLSSCTEECKSHVDADDDYKCDNCGADYDDGDEAELPATVTVKFTVKVNGGDNVSGVKFTVKKGNTETALTTGSDGSVTKTLEVGKYTVDYDSDSLPTYHLATTYSFELKADSTGVTLEIVDNTPDGSKDRPFFLAEKENTVTVPAGTEHYFSFHGTSDSHLEVRSDDIVVTLEGVTYTPENGIVTVYFEDSMGTAIKFSVKNNASESRDMEIALVSPLGSRENPIELTETSKTVPIENGNSVYYKWIATESGILVLKSENDKNNIGMTNINTNAASAQTLGEKGSYLTVNEGDEVLIAVSSVSNDAAEIDFALNIYSGTESDPLPVIKDKIDISLAPGASFTFTAEEGTEITVSNADVTVTIGTAVHEPNSLDMIIVTLEGTNIFTVTNTAAEQNGVVIEFE